MKAMIFAAGLGTRLKPWTDTHPKALAVVNGKPLLQRNIEWLQSYGINEVVVNVHHFADQIIDTLENNNGWKSSFIISDETNEVLETGGGLAKAASFLQNEKEFVVMNVDILSDMPLDLMLKQHRNSGVLATLATSDRTGSRYFLFNNENQLCGWRNEKTGEEKISQHAELYVKKAFSGIHILSNKIFNLLPPVSKYSIVDVYLQLCKTNSIQSFDHSGFKFIDAGKPESILMAEKMFI